MESRISFIFSKRRLGVAVLVCAVAAGLASEVRAQETTLADLVAGEMLLSLSGDLLFSDFDATATEGVDQNLENYDVDALEDGFRVMSATGGLSAASGQSGTLFISYVVTGVAGIQIVETLLSFEATATGSFAFALTSQVYLSEVGGIPLGSEQASVTGDSGPVPSEGFTLPGAVDSLTVVATSTVSSIPPVPAVGPDPSLSASISWVDREFITLPEPGSSLLALTALLSLAALARIRRLRLRLGQGLG